jgi:PAS domain S-box-containing protein
MNCSGKILVAGDDSESRALLAGLLTGEGYQVRSAETGERTLASVFSDPPDLIVLDVRIPGLDGFAVCRRLKEDPVTRDIPIVFVSAARKSQQRLECLRRGASDFIVKPFRREELFARIRIHVAQSHRRSELERQVAERTAELTRVSEQLQLKLAERRRSEQALIESERRFRELANQAPVAIWVTGPGNTTTFCNRRALLFAGGKMKQLIADGWTSLVHPDDLQNVYSRYLPAAAARRGFRIECRMRRANGLYRWVLNTGMPRFVNGVFCGYIGTSFDITDLKQNQERLLAAGKLESLSVLAAGIAHDFNNLLSTIFAEADLAFSELSSGSPVRKNIERIGAVAMRASEIVQLLMAYAGHGEVVMQPVNLSKSVSEMLQLLRNSLAKRASLEAFLNFEMPAVHANAPQIRQVVLNLLTNAAEALKSGQGTITVSTGSYRVEGPSAADWGEDLPAGNYGRLSVSDTGCGMSADAQCKVFDPYYTTKFLGRGLGLAVVHGIVRSHGGAIRVASGSGGSTFEVLLPCARRTRSFPNPLDPHYGGKTYMPARAVAVQNT